jgi:Icc-related predicted phosphoesterase
MRVAAMGDLHVREDNGVSYRDLFGEISREAQVLVLAGDLTDLGKPKEAELLAQDLKACSIPVVGVLGNHDYECGAAEEVARILRDAGMKVLDGQSVEIDGVGFVGVKGFAGGFGRRMLGSFGEPASKQFVNESMAEAMRLENAMRSVRSKRAMVILHYAPDRRDDRERALEIYPFLGSSRLAETIDRFKGERGGARHAHRGVYEGRTPGGQPGLQRGRFIEKPGGKPYGIIEI